MIISEIIDIAISCGDLAPIASPIGPCILFISSSEKLAIFKRCTLALCVFLEPKEPI